MTEDIDIEEPTNFVTAARASTFLAKTYVITWEAVSVLFLTVLALLSRLWLLGACVMSHDESLHVYYSWLLATGKGSAHNPMMLGHSSSSPRRV